MFSRPEINSAVTHGNFALEKVLRDVVTMQSYPVTSGNVYMVAPTTATYYPYLVKELKGSNRDGTARLYNTVSDCLDAIRALIVWTDTPWQRHDIVYIAPYTYAEAIDGLPYSNVSLIGLGGLGPDGGVKIKPAALAGSAVAASYANGLHLANIRFETPDASEEAFNVSYLGNFLIENCEFVATTTGTAFYTGNAKEGKILNSKFRGGSYGMYFAGGADKYLYSVDILGNHVIDSTTAGIYVQNTCTASESRIAHNTIRSASNIKGIDENNGNAIVEFNSIYVGGSGDAIEHAGGDAKMNWNYVNVNGTCAIEPDVSQF